MHTENLIDLGLLPHSFQKIANALGTQRGSTFTAQHRTEENEESSRHFILEFPASGYSDGDKDYGGLESWKIDPSVAASYSDSMEPPYSDVI